MNIIFCSADTTKKRKEHPSWIAKINLPTTRVILPTIMSVIKMLPIQNIDRKPFQIAIILIHFILLQVKALNLELHPIRHHPVKQGRFKSPLLFFASSFQHLLCIPGRSYSGIIWPFQSASCLVPVRLLSSVKLISLISRYFLYYYFPFHTPYFWGDMMKNNLSKLLFKSTSTRRYFITLPVWLQIILHENHSYIDTAAQLHHVAGILLQQKNLA